jgi:hypothetical protein
MKGVRVPDTKDKLILEGREYIVSYTDYVKGEILLKFDAKQLIKDRQDNWKEENNE